MEEESSRFPTKHFCGMLHTEAAVLLGPVCICTRVSARLRACVCTPLCPTAVASSLPSRRFCYDDGHGHVMPL